MEVMRVLVSAESAVLSVESTAVSEAADVLNALDKAATVVLRARVSIAIKFEMEMCAFMMLVAKPGSFPIALANSPSVSNEVVNPTPAMAAICTFA